jgi:hypothetical protein
MPETPPKTYGPTGPAMDRIREQLNSNNNPTLSQLGEPTKEVLLDQLDKTIKIAESIPTPDDSIIQCLGKLLGARLKLTPQDMSPKPTNPFRPRR